MNWPSASAKQRFSLVFIFVFWRDKWIIARAPQANVLPATICDAGRGVGLECSYHGLKKFRVPGVVRIQECNIRTACFPQRAIASGCGPGIDLLEYPYAVVLSGKSLESLPREISRAVVDDN